MATYSSFLGQGDGYTKSQRTGLRRSAEIKKRRKEEERTFEKAQEREKGERALTERRMMEAGATRRAVMGETGATGRERMSNVGMMARQRLVGEQGVEVARVKAFGEADVASMKYARGLTTGEIGHRRAMELAKAKGQGELDTLFASPGEGAGAAQGREGGVSKSVLTDFLDMDDSQKRTYMDRLKKEDPDTFLSLAKQYKLWSAPRKESSEGVGGSRASGNPIYRSDSGTYRNF